MAGNFRFDLKPSDLGWHPDDSEGSFALWDCYCMLDDGAKCALEFFSRPWYPIIDYRAEEANHPLAILKIITSEGKEHIYRQSFPDSEFRASKETLDVTIGNNRLLGKFSPDGKYAGLDVKMSGGGIAADLTWSVRVGTMKMSTREDNLTYYNPADKKYFGWFTAGARSKVEGTLTINGKATKVSGLGLNNYQWGNAQLSEFQSRWFWTLLHAGDYTLTYNDATANKNYKYAHFTPFVLWRGSDVIMSTYNCTAYGEEFRIDQVSGAPYPAVETFKAADDGIEVLGYMPPGVIAESSKAANIPGFPFTEDRPSFHVVQFSDVNLLIRQGGQVEKVKGQAMREFIWIDELFPLNK